MNVDDRYLSTEERIGYELRRLYAGFGYVPYKLSKFEPYDLYAENRSFLAGDHILTFHDLNGKLMALKPDLTLSIMKNYRSGQEKVYYDEYVYREGSAQKEFREIPQAGIECIGTLDAYKQFEVLYLAAESMKMITGRWILNVASMHTVEGLLEQSKADNETRNALQQCVRQKNVPGAEKYCRKAGFDDALTDAWKTVTGLYGPIDRTLDVLRRVTLNAAMQEAVDELEGIRRLFDMSPEAEGIHLDFSIVSDRSYYNGIVFKGYADGVHTEVLSGGRYDHLAAHLGKRAQAIGFAVYLDLLNQIGMPGKKRRADVLLCYDRDTDPESVFREALSIRSQGRSVYVQEGNPTDGEQYGEIIRMGKRGRQ